jgi:hypothetical protein
LVVSSFAGVAFRLGAAAGFFAGSAFGFAGAFTLGFASASGLAFSTLGFVSFGFVAATAFLTVALAFAPMAAVDDFVASRGERRVGPVDAFFAGIAIFDN